MGTATQKDFETQRMLNMARAQAAREAKVLEQAKRAAQRSKHIAGAMLNPSQLEEQKRQRAREAGAKIRNERESAEAAKKAAEEERRQFESARREHAAQAGEVAKERLRARKAEERRKLEAASLENLQRQTHAEMLEQQAREARAEQRRLRSETSFFSRAHEV